MGDDDNTLVFCDLFAYADQSLAWLHIFQTGPSQVVALVVEPSDNPGDSAVNGAERLLLALSSTFGELGEIRVFAQFPGDARGPGWTEILPGSPRADFERRSLQEVTMICPGAAEVSWPTDDYSCTALGGDAHPLLRLIPEPEPEHNPLEDLTVVAVADLPWAHNPFQCAHIERFRQLEAHYPSTEAGLSAVGAHWYAMLTDEDFRECHYHAANWARIAAVSVELFHQLQAGVTLNSIPDAAVQKLGDTDEASFCGSLFTDPITYRPCQASVSGGQHRACALRASGAPLCVVDVGGEYIGEPEPADPNRRACAHVAQYWANRTADD